LVYERLAGGDGLAATRSVACAFNRAEENLIGRENDVFAAGGNVRLARLLRELL